MTLAESLNLSVAWIPHLQNYIQIILLPCLTRSCADYFITVCKMSSKTNRGDAMEVLTITFFIAGKLYNIKYLVDLVLENILLTWESDIVRNHMSSSYLLSFLCYLYARVFK